MADEEPVAGKSTARKADGITQAARMQQLEKWLAQRRAHTWIFQKALAEWGIGDRQVRVLIKRIRLRREKETAAQRPYEREDLAATMELVIAEAVEKGDLETARKAARDLMQFRGYLNDDPPPAPPPAAQLPGVNIGQVVLDMRNLSPIERRARIAELYRRRELAGLPVVGDPIASTPRIALDDVPGNGAGGDHDDEPAEED